MSLEDFREAIRQYHAEEERKKHRSEEKKPRAERKAAAQVPSLPAPASLPKSDALPHSDLKEDYTGSVCMLHKLTPKTPVYEEVLLDVEDFERLNDQSWRIDRWGRNKTKYAVSKKAVQLAVVIMNAPKGTA